MTRFNCNDHNLYCHYCNNSPNSDNEMCEYCFDDMSIKFQCCLCDNIYYYYNYYSNPSVCNSFVNKSNTIKQYIKRYIFRKKLNQYYNHILDEYVNPKSLCIKYIVENFDNYYKKKQLLYIYKNKLKKIIIK